MIEEAREHRMVGPAAMEIVRDSLLAAVLNATPGDRWYLSAASLNDYALWDNSSRQFAAVFPEAADNDVIRVGDLLRELSGRCELRVIVRDRVGLGRLMEASVAGVRALRISADAKLPLGVFGRSFTCFASWSVGTGGLEVMDSVAEICLSHDVDATHRISQVSAKLDETWPNLAEATP